ncbi:MAG: hypothetical protein VB958_00025 [Thalassolituus sp.]|uniref:hypothetical protein n=1 Tax=Thalassolituus sp. TaxID=2030822 RepID=UPI0039825F89
MKYYRVILITLTAFSTWASATPNCQHANSWQCQQHNSQTGQSVPTDTTTAPGMTPDQTDVNPHLGTGTPPTSGIIVQPVINHPVSTSQYLIPTPMPNLAPNQVNSPVPTPTPQGTPQLQPQAMNTPNQVNSPVPTPTPQGTPQLQPQAMNVPNQVNNTSTTYLLINQNKPSTSPIAVYKQNSIEVHPTIPTYEDSPGFHLTMAGISIPETSYNFIARPKAKPGTFTFYFDFASATVHKDQEPVFDEIVKRYQHRKSPLIVTGETDGFGSHAFNYVLAQHRSAIIIKELISRGIQEEEIELHLKVRCCRTEAVTESVVAATQNERITWVQVDVDVR